MDKQKNVYNKCRTCLNKTKGGIHSLFEESSREMSYAELLKEVTNINIEEDNNDELPRHICGCCSRKLKSSHAFIKQAQENNDKLLSMLNTESPEKLPLDCLQESVIDIQTCLEIKMESGDEGDNGSKHSMEHCEVELKTHVNDSDEGPLTTTESNVAEAKPTPEEVDELPLADDDVDTDSSRRDADFSESDSDNEDFNSTDPNWQNKLESSPQKCNRKEKKRSSSKEITSKDLAIAVPCLQCNKIFKNSKVLSRHLRNTHVPEEQKCACPLCGVKFTRTCNMFKHMRTQHDPDTVKTLLPASEKMHQCDKCPQKYTKKKHLNNHIKAKHSNDTEVGDKSADDSKAKTEDRSLCSICGCSFSKKAYLIVHMRRHTGERPFKCDLCDRAFPHNSELKCHRRIHTGEKPYKCKLCEKAFRVYKKLATHMRSHTDERPYKCNQCERSFKYSKDLNIHNRIHTGERPYCCTVCGSTFTQSNSLKAHRMKLGHMENTEPPPPLMQLLT